MHDHRDLAALQARSLRLQDWIRKQTYSSENEKVLRRFSEWEVVSEWELDTRKNPAI